MGSHFDDYGTPPPRHHRRDRAPYPYDDMTDEFAAPDPRGRPPPPRGAGAGAGAVPMNGVPGGSGVGEVPPSHLPPPPLGHDAALDGSDGLRPALKREGSRSRLQPGISPQFPDEASFLGSTAPDLERKNRPKDRAFRDLRDGYESDEGEAHKKMMGGNGRRNRADDGGRGSGRRPPQDRGYPPDDSAVSRRPRDDPPPYDDAPPRRRRRDPDYDEDYPPPRRGGGGRPPPDVEYGSDPIPARRRGDRRGPRRRSDYDDEDEYDDYDDYKPRRRRSFDDHRRRPSRRDDDYYSDVTAPRRRDRYDDYDRPPRRDRSRSRRRYSDDYDDYDRYDRRGGGDRRRDRDRPPKEMKIGNYDIGPLVQKGQKHWGTVAPILTPIVLNMARKYMSGGGKR